MVITFHGDNFFRIVSGQKTVLVDPINARQKADLTLKTLSHPDKIGSSDDCLDLAGDFNIGGLDLKGVQMIEESSSEFIKTIFSLSGLDDLRLAFLGHLSSVPSGDALEKLGRVDLLFLPIGQPPYLSLEDSQKIVKQLNPKIIIPSLHGSKDLSDQVIKNLGRSGSVESKLVIKSKDLPEQGPLVVILKKD